MSKELVDVNNPYELLVILRKNKLLFKYLERNFRIEFLGNESEWVILGDSVDGEFSASVLSTGVLKLRLPIYVPEEIPFSAVASVVGPFNFDHEGVVMMSEDSKGQPLVTYMLYCTLSTLDEALEKFYEERSYLDNSFDSVLSMIDQMKSNFSKETKVDFGSDSKQEKSSDNGWSFLEDLDKKPNDENEDEDEDDKGDDDDTQPA